MAFEFSGIKGDAALKPGNECSPDLSIIA